jgi:type II secretory pathway pseudopilin PulG
MLELLVAMAILAIGIVGVLQVFSSSTLTVKAAESNSNMALLAQQVAGELERQPNLEAGQLSGSFGPDLPDYAWQAEIQQSSEANLYRAEIRVIRESGDRRKFYRMFTCLRSTQQSGSPGPTSGTSPSPAPPPGGPG